VHLEESLPTGRCGLPAGEREPSGLSKIGGLDLEVGYSARAATEWVGLVGALSAFELIESTAAHVARARQVQVGRT